MVALLAWAARDDVRAQLVITEDTTITEVVPGGIHIEGDATVRIAPGGRVEGDITGDNPGLTTPRVVVEGGVVDGNIGDPFPGSVRIVSGLVTGDVVVIVFSVSIEGGVVLGRVDGLSADVLISGGFVGEALVSDFPLDVRGGTIRQVAGDSVLLSGGRVLDGIHIVPAIAGATTVVKGIDIEITDETIRGRLLDGSDFGEGQPFTLLDDAPLEIVNHPNALYAVPSAPIVGSCTGLDVTVFLAAECEAEGLSFGLAHDSDELVPVSVEQGAAIASLRGGEGPEVWEVDLDPVSSAGITVLAIGSLTDPLEARLPAGHEVEIARIRYDVLPGAPIGWPSTRLRFEDGLVPDEEASPVPLAAMCGGETIELAASGIALSLAPCMARGDTNADDVVNITDPVIVLLWLFNAGELSFVPPCVDALDFDDDGTIQITDAIYGLGWLFLGGPAPPPPFASCGVDPTVDGLPCDLPTCF